MKINKIILCASILYFSAILNASSLKLITASEISAIHNNLILLKEQYKNYKIDIKCLKNTDNKIHEQEFDPYIPLLVDSVFHLQNMDSISKR